MSRPTRKRKFKNTVLLKKNTCNTIFEAVRANNLNVLKNLIHKNHSLDVRDNRGYTALHEAAYLNHWECLKKLLEKCILKDKELINLRGHEGYTALHVAVERQSEVCVKQLLEFRADINQTDCFDQTPLHLAVNQLNETMVDIILNSKATLNLNQLNYNNMSPVDIAIDNCHPTIFLKLFNKGGLITISHELIFTMFMEFPDVIKTIVHHQRSILKPPGEESVDEIVTELLSLDPEITIDKAMSQNCFLAFKLLYHTLDDSSVDYLHLLHCRPNPPESDEYLKYMLKYSPNKINATSFERTTPMDTSVLNKVFSKFSSPSMNDIELFVKYGVSLNPVNKTKPLLKAIKYRNIDCARFLIKNGAEMNVLDKHGCHLSMLALCLGHKSFFLHLLFCGLDVKLIFMQNTYNAPFIFGSIPSEQDFAWFYRHAIHFCNVKHIPSVLKQFVSQEDFDYLVSVAGSPRSLKNLASMVIRKRLNLLTMVYGDGSLHNLLPQYLIKYVLTLGFEFENLYESHL